MEEFPAFNQNLKVMLFLGALTYPSDSKWNVDGFTDVIKDTKRTTEQIQKVHDCLYKYSHQKLDYFCSTPELAFLYLHFYENCTNPLEGEGFPEILLHIFKWC